MYELRNLTPHPFSFQASAGHRVPLEVLVNLRSDITPTLIKDCIAVLKGASFVLDDVKVTNDAVQRLAWLASVAAATIVPTYRNALPLLMLPLLHTGMPNAAVLSCFERLVRSSSHFRSPSFRRDMFRMSYPSCAGVDPPRPIL